MCVCVCKDVGAIEKKGDSRLGVDGGKRERRGGGSCQKVKRLEGEEKKEWC